MRKYLAHLYIYASVFLLSACGGQIQQATVTPTPITSLIPAIVSETEAESLPTWVVIEREASASGNLALLAALWAEDGRIVDGRGTVSPTDDYVWSGRAAILDRYEIAVFPAPPPLLTIDDLADATLTMEAEQATLINGGDRWQFILRDGRWWLHQLVYSAP